MYFFFTCLYIFSVSHYYHYIYITSTLTTYLEKVNYLHELNKLTFKSKNQTMNVYTQFVSNQNYLQGFYKYKTYLIHV